MMRVYFDVKTKLFSPIFTFDEDKKEHQSGQKRFQMEYGSCLFRFVRKPKQWNERCHFA